MYHCHIVILSPLWYSPRMKSITIQLPKPPSANQLFVPNRRASKGRPVFPSKAYVSWQKEADKQLLEQWAKSGESAIQGEYGIIILANVSRRADIDNLAKPILDLLVTNKIVPDDRFAKFCLAYDIRDLTLATSLSMPVLVSAIQLNSKKSFLEFLPKGVRRAEKELSRTVTQLELDK